MVTTGIGFRGWMEAADGWGLGEALREELAGAELLARGPEGAGCDPRLRAARAVVARLGVGERGTRQASGARPHRGAHRRPAARRAAPRRGGRPGRGRSGFPWSCPTARGSGRSCASCAASCRRGGAACCRSPDTGWSFGVAPPSWTGGSWRCRRHRWPCSGHWPPSPAGRSREDLQPALPRDGSDTHAVEMAVTRLRALLGDPRIVATVVKRGYRLAYEPEWLADSCLGME